MTDKTITTAREHARQWGISETNARNRLDMLVLNGMATKRTVMRRVSGRDGSLTAFPAKRVTEYTLK